MDFLRQVEQPVAVASPAPMESPQRRQYRVLASGDHAASAMARDAGGKLRPTHVSLTSLKQREPPMMPRRTRLRARHAIGASYRAFASCRKLLAACRTRVVAA